MQQGICKYGEQLFPDFLSANSLTIIGQAPLFVIMMSVFALYGPNIDAQNAPPLSRELILLGGCLLYWFSLVDIMDGNRARRLKVGSPLGRIIDEGGDTITMANYSVFIAYVWGFTNPAFEILYLALNFVFYAMEMRNKITGNLIMNVGELSPCELELMFSISLILSGIFGTEFLGKTPGDYLGIPPGSKCPLHVVCEYQLRDIWGCFLFLVAIALLGDSLQDSLRHSVTKTIYFYLPVLFCLGMFFAMT